MRFLANENFPAAAVNALSSSGEDVIWIRRVAPGAGDQEVLAQAARDERILLTFDKDFGELAAATRLPAACGIVLFRMTMPKSAEVGRRLTALLTARSDWSGHFSVIEPGRIRMRPLS